MPRRSHESTWSRPGRSGSKAAPPHYREETRSREAGGVTPPRRTDGDAVSAAAEEVDGDAGAARPTSAPSTGRETMAALEGGNSLVAHRQFFILFDFFFFSLPELNSTIFR